jgi:aryl-alcohol dehydrogenase-like predicted oxidoreductase
MHHIDRATPWEEIWQAMEVLVEQGKIIYVGSSNFAAWNIARANEMAHHRHFLGLVCEQSLYNLLTRTVELEVLPVCRAYGLGVIPWSPLANGLRAGALHKAEADRRASSQVKAALEQNRTKLEAYEHFCTQLGEEPAQVALAWLLANPVVTAPIIGPCTTEQLDQNLHALEISLPKETLSRPDEIFPGPGGAAPEAYAW